MHSQLYPIDKLYMADFYRFSKARILISQPNMNQIKRFMDQNLNWLIEGRKQFQF